MGSLKAGRLLILTQKRFNSIIKSSPFEINKFPNTTLTKYIFKDASKYKKFPAITSGLNNRTLKYEDLETLINKVHYSLKKIVGLESGQVVGLILPNTTEFPVAVYGALQGGLQVTFINPIFTPDEISKQFINAEVKCIITMPESKQCVDQVEQKLKGYKGTIYLDDKGEWEFKGSSLLKNSKQDLEKPNIDPNSIAILPYSSGTTGVPKGVMLSHNNCVDNLEQLTHPSLKRFETTDEYQDRSLNVIPFYHIYGFNGIMNYCLEGGNHIITLPKFIPEDYINCLIKYKPTILFTVPSLIMFLASHPEVKPEHLESVTKVSTGAAPASRALIEKFKTKLQRDDVIITQGYGLSETSPVVLITPTNTPESKTGSTGMLVPSTHGRVVCLETGKDLPANQKGELWVKGPQVMKGYLKNEEATNETIDSDGWLHTGDVVYYDEDDYFYIVDRCKELIKCKGNQVSPTELEALLMEIDEVADVAVVGIPDEKCGELPKAFIVLKPNKKLSENTINDFINPKIAPYKRLKGGISFINSIPRNHAGKIIRKQLKEMK